MVHSLEICTLGAVEIRIDGAPIPPLASRKAEALLIYLACSPGLHFREVLVERLWDDPHPSRGLANLSVLLTSLRKHLGAVLETDAMRVGLSSETPLTLDSADLERILTESQRGDLALNAQTVPEIEAALALYRGDFLAGYHLRGSRGFDEWAAIERERLRYIVFEAMNRLAQYYLHSAQNAAGLQTANRLLQIDPYREETHRLVMRLLVRNGRRHEALAQYEAFEALLANDLDVQPEPASRMLFERIRDSNSRTLSNLPVTLTSFIGRRKELAQIAEKLANPKIRLLTLVGPGGVGKSRLALAAAASQSDMFLDGVHLISLESTDSETPLAPVIAVKLGFSFYKTANLETQLFDFLLDKELLLVLDNFEHMLPAAEFIERLLLKAPEVKILVTSRERLNMRGEWLMDVHGLDLSKEGDAAQLFSEVARRVRSDFHPDAGARAAIDRINRQVGGFPLGIEIAAAWIRTLTPGDIAAEIEADLGFLEHPFAQTGDRHRSMRSVLEYSWGMLTPSERATFKRLAVLHAGFDRAAAQTIGQANLQVLNGLVNKSLLQRSIDGYRSHELLRQFAMEKLADEPAEENTIRQAHSRYFLRGVEALQRQLRDRMHDQAMKAIDKDLRNIRAAWHDAARRGDSGLLNGSADGLFEFFKMRGRFQEGIELFMEAARGAGAPVRVQARMGALQIYVSEYPEARKNLETALQAANKAGDHFEAAFCLLNLANIARRQGENDRLTSLTEQALSMHAWPEDSWVLRRGTYLLGLAALLRGRIQEAKGHLDACLEGSVMSGDPRQTLSSLSALGDWACHVGDYSRALDYFKESLAISREIGDRYWIGLQLNNLGTVAHVLEDYDQAQQYYSDSLYICETLGDIDGQVYALSNLGEVAYEKQDYLTAESHAARGLQLARRIANLRMQAVNANNLGLIAAAVGRFTEARERFRTALRLAQDLNARPQILSVLVNLADLWIRTDRPEEALRALSHVLQQEAAEQHLLDKAGRLAEKVGKPNDEPDPGFYEWLEQLMIGNAL